MKRPPDMTRAQFNAKLRQYGFKQTLMWFNDTTGQVPNVSWGGLFWQNGKLARRATLARIIKGRDEEIAKRERKENEATTHEQPTQV